ncbi:hypothetical protein D3C72_2232040 [compost metagenome]
MEVENHEPDWRDEDILAVRKVFILLDKFISHTGGGMQIIVLDHADDEVWHGLTNVHVVEEWRGTALVPYEWKTQQ